MGGAIFFFLFSLFQKLEFSCLFFVPRVNVVFFPYFFFNLILKKEICLLYSHCKLS